MKNTEPMSTNEIVYSNNKTEKFVKSILHLKYPFPYNGKSSLLLYGTYGTGKTTFTKLFCNEFEMALTKSKNIPIVNFVECDNTDASNHLIKKLEKQTKFISLNESNFHYYIFDEIDNLTEKGQKLLKTFLNKRNIICLLTTNYIYQIDKGLQDRCHLVNFNMSSNSLIQNRIKDIFKKNNLKAPSNLKLNKIIDNSNGSWRNILSNTVLELNQI